ncbi:iron-siderophore ABC transporter substrate-binding protein [Arthrobacter ginkgonis]|uniref:Iron-siderophore ABC transporter substrate-binding protein n=1 Tax=Arthrobacter ginkgonis TaxID=1630594 RepID=A0ABP7CIH3_9MICC
MKAPSTRTRLAGAALAAALLLTGCAGQSGTAQSGAETSGTTGSQAAAAGTVVVDSAFGPVTIPATPERVIALEGGTVPAVEAGIVPVATAGDVFDDSFADADDYAPVADLPAILGPDGWDYERIVELKPDLLIGFVRGGDDASAELSAEKKAEWEKLNAIAPTVFIRSNGSAGVRDASLTVAEALGNGEAAQADKAAYLAKVEQVKADYADTLAQTSFAALDAYEDVTVYSRISWIGAVLNDLGAQFPEAVAGETAENGVFLSFEQLSRIDDADVVLYSSYLDGSSDAFDVLKSQSTFAALPAVKEDRAFAVTHFFPDNYATATVVVEQVEDILKTL